MIALAADEHARDLDRFLRAECGMSLAEWSLRNRRTSLGNDGAVGREAVMQAKERRIVGSSSRRTA